MKTLILGALLILAVSFCGCGKTENPVIENDKKASVQVAELITYDLGYESFIADEIRFTSFQGQGLFIMLNGEVLKQVTKDNIKSLTFK